MQVYLAMSFEVLRPQGAGQFVIICDHASNFVPPELDDLGLASDALKQHIAWDIGAAGIARELSSIFDATTVLNGASRLVVDCNRHLDADDLIPRQSHGIVVPGNANLTDRERTSRLERWFHPYHGVIESILNGRVKRGESSIVLSIHSMTAVLSGSARPWQISLSSYRDRSLVEPLLAALRRSGDILVGDNQPYDLNPDIDFSTPFHALRRNLRHIQVEFRQDEVGEEVAQVAWARRFAAALSESLSLRFDRFFHA